MSGFVAIILIWQMALPADASTEASARDVLSVHADNEIGCTSGCQDAVARSPLAGDIGKAAMSRRCAGAPSRRRGNRNENAWRTKALIRRAPK